MRKQRELRLWKAYWVSRKGSPGPYHLIEGYDYGEVLKEARQRCRLADFPDVWTVRIEVTDRVYSVANTLRGISNRQSTKKSKTLADV